MPKVATNLETDGPAMQNKRDRCHLIFEIHHSAFQVDKVHGRQMVGSLRRRYNAVPETNCAKANAEDIVEVAI